MPYIGNSLVTTVSDEAVTFAKIQDVAANSVLGRNANSSGDLSEIALATTQILIGDGTGFTAAALSGDATMTNAGVVSLDNAQTNIASILRTDVKIGEDDQTKIDFETADEIHFYAANVEQVYVADNIFGPQSDSDVDLGSTSIRWKDAFVDSITVTGEVDAVTLDISGNADIDGTLEADAITIGGVAIGSIYGAVAGSTSILTVGALDTGSITSGFTSIDVGSGAITTTGIITGGTVEATTDTAAGDNAAIGYTSGEGLILTGQGSTNDVTIKNDADTTVISIPTGATGVTFAGTIGSGAITSTGIVTGTGFTAGNAVLAEAELELLDGITAGTAAASKVLVLDANKDIGTIRNLTIDGVFTDGNYTFDTSGNVSGLGTVASGAITSSGIIKTDSTTAATTTTDGSLQTDGGLSVVLDAVFGNDVKLLSDSAVLVFGAGSDITLTHTNDVGLTLNGTSKLMFNDASQFIQGASATVLDIAATDEIELTATLIDVVGNFANSGTIASTGVITANAGVVVDNITIDGTEIDLSSGDLTIDVAGDIEVNADGGQIIFKDGSAAIAELSNESGNGELRIYEGANYLGFKTPALSANQVWVLPDDDGSANQYMKTDGNGNLAWVSASSGVGIGLVLALG